MSIPYTDSFINTKIFSNYFKELCQNFVPPYRDDNVSINKFRIESNNRILNFLFEMQRLIKEKKCDIEVFKNEVCQLQRLSILHIEVFWYIDVCNIIKLNSFIRFHEEKKNIEVIQHLADSIFNRLIEYESNSTSIRKEVLLAYMKAVFATESAQQEELESSVRKVIMNLISENLKEFYHFESVGDVCCTKKYLSMSKFIQLLEEADIADIIIRSCVYFILKKLLQSTPQTIKRLFQTQESVKNNVKNQRISEFYSVIFKYILLDELIEILRNFFLTNPKSINTIYLLSLITYLGQCHQDGWTKLKNLSRIILKESFQNMCSRLMSLVFIIARQSCFEKTKTCFGTYTNWFTHTFSSESCTQIKSHENNKFFFDYLSNLVSIDPVYYTKIHLNKCPKVPLNYQYLVHDYVTLVETKLSDLNVSTDLGLFENPTEKSAAANDVDKVIEHFEATNTILGTVFQAAMFNKRYYEKKFLVELLSKFESENSSRHKVIIKLNSLGKIPNAAFKKYKTLEKNFKE